MKETSQRLSKAPKSVIRELFDLALGRSDVISLGIGQPDFSTPKPVIQGNIDALRKKITMYAPTRGVSELLELIEEKMRKFSEKSGIPMDHLDLVLWYYETGEVFK